ncbi:hypothetical protein QL112_009190 [Xenorhabdus griffiniae]|uniref:Inverse autotransporter beta-barrel domain-containing protein n=1 Tax=Xenorhabdus griffiniae TaxID=351672 RepID=A0ABY9XMT5_9GAMM|nr:hypothetical protein [Xenorhabdus griffiniae]WMV74139.1 hypothetical protein QL128_09185 [Xenorhabdus griffiniae]WNH03819.1 hypothetical protein QL112_009190 [Xenorhabdus griffiniae]
MNKNKEIFEKQGASPNNQPPQPAAAKDDYQVTLSLESGTNVFIGQEIYLKVTIKSTTNDVSSLNNIGSVIIKDPTGKKSISYKIYESYSAVIPQNKADSYGEAILALTIHKPNDNNQLNLSISVQDKHKRPIPGFNDRPVKYTVINNILADSVVLKTKNEFIATPTTVNSISDPNSIYNLYSGIISDNNINPIGNIQVVIAAQRHNQLSPSAGLVKITHDRATGANEPIDIMTLPDGRDFFVLTSDPQGEISFRAYPTAGAEGRVDFVAKIQNLTMDDYTAAMCIYPAYSQNHPLDNPFINEMEEGGTLKKLPGQTDFTVSVNSYDGYMTPGSKDVIAFFTEYDGTTQKTLLSPTYRVNNKVDRIEDRVFSFPYDQLEPNKPGGIYYAIISGNNNIMYSESLNFKYVLDLDSPDDNNKGIYDKVTVYTTYADLPIKPSNTNGIISESSAVIFDLISQGLVFGEGKNNSNSAGLYVLIKAAGTSTIENSPQPNQNGKVRVRIKSSKGLVSKEYDFDLKNLKKDGSVKYQVVTIPFCFLKGILPIDGYNPSRLYIDYYIITDNLTGEKTYSKTWGVDINTMGPDENDNYDYYGCSS